MADSKRVGDKGDDYYTNFHEGDPFIKIDEGYARLPGVAPYSSEYHTFRQKVSQQAQGKTELEIEYEKILTRVKQNRESVIKMNDRHFTEPVDSPGPVVGSTVLNAVRE